MRDLVLTEAHPAEVRLVGRESAQEAEWSARDFSRSLRVGLQDHELLDGEGGVCIQPRAGLGGDWTVPVPTLATLNADRRCNPRAVRLALKLARQTSGSTELPVAERDDYVRSLIAYAEDTAAGHVPPESWQLRHLGHLVAG